MNSDFFFQSLKVINLVTHLIAIFCVSLQVFHARISIREWQEAWVAVLVGMILIIPFRLADMFVDPDYWRLLLAFPMTLCLFLGFYRLSQILQKQEGGNGR